MPTRPLPAFLADTPIIDGSLSGVSSMPFLDELIYGGFHAANWTVAGGYGDGTLSTLAKIAERYSLMEQHPDKLLLVERPADIERAKREGKLGVILGFQGIETLEGRFHLLAIYHKLGVRVVGLTYNNRNVVGSGCLEPDDGRLTRFGIEVVREMNRLGILVDLTHVGNRTSLDAASASLRARRLLPLQRQGGAKQPAQSHRRADQGLCGNGRGHRHRDLRRLRGRHDGWPAARPSPSISGTSTTSRGLVGVDHVGIGTDIFADPTHGTWWNSNTRMRYPEICGGMTYETHGLAGFEHHTEFPTVVEAMISHGYSEGDIREDRRRELDAGLPQGLARLNDRQSRCSAQPVGNVANGNIQGGFIMMKRLGSFWWRWPCSSPLVSEAGHPNPAAR